MNYNAIITAGGRIKGDFADLAGTSIKAMIKIKGKSLLYNTVFALKKCDRIKEVTIVGPESIKDSEDVRGSDNFINAHESGIINILRGLEFYKNDPYIIFCTSDLPFITVEAVSDFINRCPEKTSICYPIFEKNEIYEGIRPGIPSYIKLKEGQFTGGSIFRLNTPLCLSRISEIGKSFNARKSTLDMARLLGFKIMLKYLLGTLSLNDILKRAEKILNFDCEAIRGCDPSITFDIDDIASYRFALSYQNSNVV